MLIISLNFLQLRIRYGLPVIISGETGCGKSSLIKQLCAVIGLKLRILNIHGGMESESIQVNLTCAPLCNWLIRQRAGVDEAVYRGSRGSA